MPIAYNDDPTYNNDPKIRLFGLLVNCPYGNPRKECPFERFRSDNLHELRDLAVGGIESDLAECLMDYHDYCLENRESSSSKEDTAPFIQRGNHAETLTDEKAYL